jgi:hypothetical protein
VSAQVVSWLDRTAWHLGYSPTRRVGFPFLALGSPEPLDWSDSAADEAEVAARRAARTLARAGLVALACSFAAVLLTPLITLQVTVWVAQIAGALGVTDVPPLGLLFLPGGIVALLAAVAPLWLVSRHVSRLARPVVALLINAPDWTADEQAARAAGLDDEAHPLLAEALRRSLRGKQH